jgi:peptidoglycan hydrolase-like protein with peptidoglycan-binding domain
MKPMFSLLVATLAAGAMASAFAANTVFVDDNTVRQAQKTLNDRGYRTGGVDGKMGPQTQAALVNFQRAEKLKPTGRLDGATLAALGLEKGNAGGSSRYDAATIRKVQETLNDRGFKAGPPNGVLGERTSAALREFQKSENFAVTGQLNPRTLAALGIPEQPASAGATRGGDASSVTIREMQRRLTSRGYPAGPADGVMGRTTRSALTDFQRAQKLPVTGQPDRATLAALGIGTGMAAKR